MAKGRVIGFKQRPRSSEEELSIYPREIVDLEEKIDELREKHKQRILKHGVGSIKKEDMNNADLLIYQVNLLYEIHGFVLQDENS